MTHRIKLTSKIIVTLWLCSATTFADDFIVGFTEPVKTIELAASETGTLAKLSVKRGDRVMANTIVGSLDFAVLEAQREIAVARQESSARFKSARIRRDRAKRDFEKLRQLQAEGMGSARELQIAESDFELAQTDIESVAEEVQIAALEINRIDAEIQRRSIVSPIDGVVTEVQREVGEFVSMTEPHVLTIVDLSQLRIRFYPATQQAEPLHTGDTIHVKFVHSGEVAAAFVEFIAPVIDADSDTIQVDILLRNQDGNRRSGRRCLLLTNTAQSAPQPLQQTTRQFEYQRPSGRQPQ